MSRRHERVFNTYVSHIGVVAGRTDRVVTATSRHRFAARLQIADSPIAHTALDSTGGLTEEYDDELTLEGLE